MTETMHVQLLIHRNFVQNNLKKIQEQAPDSKYCLSSDLSMTKTMQVQILIHRRFVQK